MTDISIAYIIFNRPRHTRETFQAIRDARPARLFIIADGPRPSHPTDAERCRAVREIVADIDWPCEVQRNYADQNLGLKRRVSSGLDWVFSQVESAIILEDDCLPHPDFFPFCQDLLERYKDDERVWTITGNNNQDGKKEVMMRTIFQSMVIAGAGRLGGVLGPNMMAISSFGQNGNFPRIGVIKLPILMSKAIGSIF